MNTKCISLGQNEYLIYDPEKAVLWTPYRPTASIGIKYYNGIPFLVDDAMEFDNLENAEPCSESLKILKDIFLATRPDMIVVTAGIFTEILKESFFSGKEKQELIREIMKTAPEVKGLEKYLEDNKGLYAFLMEMSENQGLTGDEIQVFTDLVKHDKGWLKGLDLPEVYWDEKKPADLSKILKKQTEVITKVGSIPLLKGKETSTQQEIHKVIVEKLDKAGLSEVTFGIEEDASVGENREIHFLTKTPKSLLRLINLLKIKPKDLKRIKS